MTLRLTPDPGLRRLSDGRTLLGGTPYRVMRLNPPAARLVSGWFEGGVVRDLPPHRQLARRLTDLGMAHPDHGVPRLTAADVTAVVPVRDHPGGARLPHLLDAVADVVVVDDGSAVPVVGAAVRHPVPGGPAAARNSGWPLARTELVAFLDADVEPDEGWLDALLPHFEDPDVVAVAPRIRSRPGPSTLERYETERSPLDLGPLPATVRPGSRVSYVPTAALVVRVRALREAAGFDERLRYGEDVDLVWRLTAAGHTVRYEPASVVHHQPRATWPALLRQRFGYGSSAAPLALRHPKAAAPVKASPWSLAAWAALAAGYPRTAVLTALTTAALLPRKLEPVGVPAKESLELALRGHWGVGHQLADAATRAWWPAAVPVLAATGRGRLLLAAAVARHAVDWRRRRPAVGLPSWTAARVADDLAYGAGVWWGALRHRTTAPLRADVGDWPGRDGVCRS
ncbi:mycofactocin biosynthesis glycosyltransferase MftF [Streptomyces sp. NPDC048594]|uniref:mycofactocin biosynthesis glycosyltransferase MftF n=1 Tax=Streptomyces sp. NPDC048594 TaxID=3365575 RepID=UPI0037211DC2